MCSESRMDGFQDKIERDRFPSMSSEKACIWSTKLCCPGHHFHAAKDATRCCNNVCPALISYAGSPQADSSLAQGSSPEPCPPASLVYTRCYNGERWWIARCTLKPHKKMSVLSAYLDDLCGQSPPLSGIIEGS